MKPGWVDIQRSAGANIGLGMVLAFVAGATNAGGFLAVGSYTSHMTGIVSSVADNMVLGQWALVQLGVACFAAFLLGAMTTAWMVNWSLRRGLRSAFGRPLLLEALLLLVFGLFGSVMQMQHVILLPVTVLLLCFIMGLQNAVVTKISKAEIRTTHITGLVTDLGIELGKLLYFNGDTARKSPDTAPVLANRRKLTVHLRLICSFFVGAVSGAFGFKTLGFIATLPLSVALIALVWKPVLHDFNVWRSQ